MADAPQDGVAAAAAAPSAAVAEVAAAVQQLQLSAHEIKELLNKPEAE